MRISDWSSDVCSSDLVEVAGVTIPKGSLVNLRYGSANRDERKYECPEVFNVARANASFNLAFGAGLPLCIGAQLARREIALGPRALTARPQMKGGATCRARVRNKV